MKVFISYAGADRDLAKRVANALRRAGMSMWLFDDEIQPGENWAAKLAQGLEAAEVLISLLSPAALASRLVRHDLDFALGNSHLAGKLVPVWCGPAETLESANFPWILHRLNLLQLPVNEPQEDAIQRIVQAVQALAVS